MALTALTEPHTLRRRITPLLSSGDGLGCIAEHLGELMKCLGAPQITVEQSEKNNIFFGNTAVAPGTHSYY
jgi:hypothetical protein